MAEPSLKILGSGKGKDYMAQHYLWSTIGGVLVFLSSSMSIASAKYIKGTIVKNVDGDTVWIEPAGTARPPQWVTAKAEKSTLKIRMIGIDTPETHLPTTDHGVVGQGHWGDDAADMLAKKLPIGSKVVLEDQGRDKYGRTLGRIFLVNSDINLAMVASGWATPYIICTGSSCDEGFFEREHVAKYISACEAAEKAGRGIFDKKSPLKEMPFEFRLRMQGRKADKWVGYFETGELYTPKDYKKIPVCQRIFFMTQQDATNAGFGF